MCKSDIKNIPATTILEPLSSNDGATPTIPRLEQDTRLQTPLFLYAL